MPPRSRKRKQNQTTLEDGGVVRHLTDPQSAVGKQLKIPGSFWNWGSPQERAANENKQFSCVVHEYAALHKFAGNATAQGMQLEVLDDAGIGTTEMLWVRYPVPFLTHFYESNTELDPNHQAIVPQPAAAAANPTAAR